jgi:ubiquinone/menaquinone biosynthesis C-methylase UbiE
VLAEDDGSFDAVFAAGLVPNLAEPVAGLAELARVCRGGGLVALFHPIGRVAPSPNARWWSGL